MRPVAVRLALVAACTSSLGCSDDGRSRAAATSVTGCTAGELQRDDGACVPAGLPPDMPCPPGEWLRETDAACIPAGVPPDGCGAGFVHDGDRGCEPILPADSCPPGLMAVPGETECHEIAPCGSGTWGEIPVEPDTEHVDQSYPGADSDGSPQKPWTTIGDAMTGARDGAIVAIAAGSYVEDIYIQGGAVRLWGRCPAMVEIVGTGAQNAAVVVVGGASGAELRDIAIRGSAAGILLSGSRGVLVARAWLHDNAGRGIGAEDTFGPTSITVRSCLVEDNREVGVFVAGGEALVDATTVRGTLQNGPRKLLGRGVSAQYGTTGAPSKLTVRASVIEQSHDVGIFIGASEGLVESSVVRDTHVDGTGRDGTGVLAQSHATTGAPSTVTIRTSLLERNHETGVHVVGSEARLEATVVRDTLANDHGEHGRGVNANLGPENGAHATLTVDTSLVERNRDAGVFVLGSDAVVTASVVRGSLPNDAGPAGRGVVVGADATTSRRSTLTLGASVVEENHGLGVLVVGSDALVEATVVRATHPDAHGAHGDGVAAQSLPAIGASSNVTLRASLVEGSREAGLFVLDSNATVETSVIRTSSPSELGLFGDGVVVWSVEGGAEVTIAGCRIDQSARAAVAAFGARVELGRSKLACQTFDLFGAANGTLAFTFGDLGGNLCGCPDATSPCAAKGEGLDPPPPIGGLE